MIGMQVGNEDRVDVFGLQAHAAQIAGQHAERRPMLTPQPASMRMFRSPICNRKVFIVIFGGTQRNAACSMRSHSFGSSPAIRSNEA